MTNPHLYTNVPMWYFPTLFDGGRIQSVTIDCGILKAAKDKLTVSSKFWQKKAVFLSRMKQALKWDSPCHPLVTYSV